MGEMESQASENLANSLTNRAAELAYSNFGAERARQDAAIAQAPQMAMADYSDIQSAYKCRIILKKHYDRQALQSDIARFEFEQNKPYSKLQVLFISCIWCSCSMLIKLQLHQVEG